MNYLKSTPKRPPAPYIHKVGNQPGKLSISTLSELWYTENEMISQKLGGKYDRDKEYFRDANFFD